MYRTLYSASIGQDFIPVHIYVFAMASTVLTKEPTLDDVLQFLEDNSLGELIEAFKSKSLHTSS